jgi:hypothetical protein
MKQSKNLRPSIASLSDVEAVIGPQTTWDAKRQKADEQAAKRRPTLRIAPDELGHLQRHPPYVVHSLLHCASRVLEAPRAVFEGRRPEGMAFRAFCGRPVYQYDNDGTRALAPKNMVYVVYERDGHVFDWDWVEADPQNPSLPIDHANRFVKRLPTEATTLDVEEMQPNRFDSALAVHSPSGDCIFAYLSPVPAFAVRVNDTLTVFRSLDDRKTVVGCKIKGIQELLVHILPRLARFEPMRKPPNVWQIVTAIEDEPPTNQDYWDLFQQMRHASPTPRIDIAANTAWSPDFEMAR